jgi:hypothetical protein
MIDIDFAQATFEYIVRKKINEGELPLNDTPISCDNRYYVVNWKDVTIQDLWSKIIDEEFISLQKEEDLDCIFLQAVNHYIENLSIYDPTEPDTELKLSDLAYWIPVKNIPKKYYRR